MRGHALVAYIVGICRCEVLHAGWLRNALVKGFSNFKPSLLFENRIKGVEVPTIIEPESTGHVTIFAGWFIR